MAQPKKIKDYKYSGSYPSSQKLDRTKLPEYQPKKRIISPQLILWIVILSFGIVLSMYVQDYVAFMLLVGLSYVMLKLIYNLDNDIIQPFR